MKILLTEYFLGRFILFLLFAGGLCWWESRMRWRPWLTSRLERWVRHLSLQAFGKLCVRLVFPFTILTLAFLVQEKKIGLFYKSHLPYLTRFVLGVIALDFAVYLQHRLLHKNTLLWMVHRVHHMDRSLDVSTGVRFHPIEELLSMAIKILTITFLGIPPLAVAVFEVWLNFATLYTHANVRLKLPTERALRWLIVTPGMHRIHHSDLPPETNSNFGFCLSWWDRLFGTYRPFSRSGESKLLIGLEGYTQAKYQTLQNMLLLPFNVKQLKLNPKKNRKVKLTGENV